MKNSGMTLVEMVISMSIIVGVIVASLSLMKADQRGKEEKFAVDALASTIRIAARQASSKNINLALSAQNGTVSVMQCGTSGAPCNTSYTEIPAIKIPRIVISDGLLLGFRKDGVVASRSNWNINNMFGSLKWDSQAKITGSDQSYLLDIGRYGDVEVCDGALSSCGKEGAR